MGQINEKTIARAAQAEFESIHIAGSGGTVGGESQTVRNQQERSGRKGSERAKLPTAGTSVIGGMLDHLIEQYADQVAEKVRIISQTQEELEKLNNRIRECKELKEELNKQLDEQT